MLEQKLNSEQKDETQLPSSPNNAKPNVIGSQSTSYDLSVWGLLDRFCDGLIGFKAQGKELYKVKTTLELPTESYNRFVDFLKEKCPSGFDVTDISYAGFKFYVKELS